MIARHWRGWTKIQDANAYEALLTDKILPSLQKVEGYKGGYVFRKIGDEEAEFVVVNFFDSLEAVQRFAGADYRVPVFEPEARRLLSRIESFATHYEVRANTTLGNMV